VSGGGGAAIRRGDDQMEMIGEQHGALAATVVQAAGWAEAAAAWSEDIAKEGVWRAAVADLTGDGSAAWSWFARPAPVVSRKYAVRLDELDGRIGEAAMALAMDLHLQQLAAGVPNSDGHHQLAEAIRATRRTYRTRSYEGDLVEGMTLHRQLCWHHELWSTQVADAAHFVSAAGWTEAGLAVYVESMTDLLGAAAQTMRSAYTDLTRAVYECKLPSTLPTDTLARAEAVHYAARNIGGWMWALAEGGVSSQEREAVLSEIVASGYGDAVAEFRREDAGDGRWSEGDMR
jgi:hypothetical protein